MKRKYRRLFSNKHPRKPGLKGPSEALIQTIVEMKKRNPHFGYRRIAMQITLAFGINVDKDVVRRVLNKHHNFNPTGQGTSWLTLIGHTLDSLWSLDLFRVESILLKSHWVMVVMDQFSRQHYRICSRKKSFKWYSCLSDVELYYIKTKLAKIFINRQRPTLSISSMESEFKNLRNKRN